MKIIFIKEVKMPRGDRTGPRGFGPGTGRGLGYCNGYDSPGYVKSFGGRMGLGFGRGMGRGFGRGYGFGPSVDYGYGAPQTYNYSPDQEKEYLKNQVSEMEKTIESLKKRMEEIGKKK